MNSQDDVLFLFLHACGWILPRPSILLFGVIHLVRASGEAILGTQRYFFLFGVVHKFSVIRRSTTFFRASGEAILGTHRYFLIRRSTNSFGLFGVVQLFRASGEAILGTQRYFF